MNQMNKLIIACPKIQNPEFRCTIDDVQYESLTDFVHKISHQSFMPYSARKTCQNRANIIYHCSFSALTGCKSQLVFSQFTNFTSNHYFSFNIQDLFSIIQIIHLSKPL